MTEWVSEALEEDRSATKDTISSLRHNRQGGCYNARKLKFEHHLFPLNITNPRSVPACVRQLFPNRSTDPKSNHI